MAICENNMIKRIERKDIDKERWNSIIAASGQETIYPYTWYMDVSADQWFGLVMGDYEYIMPVAYRKKYAIKYVYQPFHNQQLGVFSDKTISNEIAQQFLQAIKREFLTGNYAFNAGNTVGKEAGCEITDRVNYVLSLNEAYELLYRNYAENTRRNVRKSCKSDLEISDKTTISRFVAFKRLHNEKKESKEFYANMERLLLELERMGKIEILSVYLGEELCAAAVFARSNNRMIYMLSASNKTGKEHRAMFHLIDSTIRLHAGKDLLLDFEGSNLPSIARYFAGFGAQAENYQRVKFNRLQIKNKKRKKNV